MYSSGLEELRAIAKELNEINLRVVQLVIGLKDAEERECHTNQSIPAPIQAAQD